MYVIQTEPAMRLRPAKQIRICCFSSNGFEFPNSQAVMHFPAKKGVTKPAKEIPKNDVIIHFLSICFGHAEVDKKHDMSLDIYRRLKHFTCFY